MVQHLRSFATVDTFDQLPDLFTEDLHLQQAAVRPLQQLVICEACRG